MQRFLIFSIPVFLLTNMRHAMAHPGHGNEQLANTPSHYLLDPFHALWTIAMIAALVCLSRSGHHLIASRIRSANHRQRLD